LHQQAYSKVLSLTIYLNKPNYYFYPMNPEQYLSAWSVKKITNNYSFEELISLDGVPVWWFYNRLFLRHVLPNPINTFQEMVGKKRLSGYKRVKLASSAPFIKYLIYFNERNKHKFFLKHRVQKQINSHSRNPDPAEIVSPIGKVLFLTYTNHLNSEGTIFRLQEIINKITDHKKLVPFLLFVDPLSSKNYKRLKNLISFYHFIDHSTLKDIRNEAQKLHEQWRKIDSPTKAKMLAIDGSFSLWTYLKYAFEVFFSPELLYLLVLYYRTALRVIELENIKAIVLSSQNGLFEKCFVAAAHKRNIPVLRIQHGIGEDLVPPTPYDHFYKLVFSDYVKRDLISKGWDAEKIKVVGPVIFDEIKDYVTQKKTSGRCILLATTASVQSSVISSANYHRRIQKIIAAISSIPDLNLNIKLHPRELPFEQCLSLYQQDLISTGAVKTRIYPGNISRREFYQLIADCDLFVNFGSTSSIEALILDKTVLTINIFDDDYITGWIKEKKISYTVHYTENIKEAIMQALQDNDQHLKLNCREFVIKKCGIIDGLASVRIVELIHNLAEKNH